MPITSTSTIADIEAQLLDNVDFAEAGSVSKAQAFIAACRAWLIKVPRDQAHGSARLAYAPEQIRALLDEALTWLNSQPDFAFATGGASYLDTTEFQA